MAVSLVSIANGALQRLGETRIESLTQDSPNARSVNAVFDKQRDALLRKYNWSFAIMRASIAADGDQTTWGGLNRYSLPNDFIRLLRDDESRTFLDWKIEGRYIVTKDAAPLRIRYVAQITDPTLYDPLFVEALECSIALVTCEEITQSSSKKESIKDDFKRTIAEATKAGFIEKPADETPDDGWITARY